MTAFLRTRKLRRTQFKSRGRARPTGCTVLHTAESILDTVGPDTGAEGVANYMVVRTTAGSYHDLADSDTWVHLVEYSDQAYQDGTGSNPWAMSLSFALAAADWPRLSPTRRAAFLRQGALAFAAQQEWLRENGYPTTPLRRITKAQSDAGMAGFVTHGDRDPGRRSDPGAAFPWDEWFAACRAATGEDDMFTDQDREDLRYAAKQAQRVEGLLMREQPSGITDIYHRLDGTNALLNAVLKDDGVDEQAVVAAVTAALVPAVLDTLGGRYPGLSKADVADAIRDVFGSLDAAPTPSQE